MSNSTGKRVTFRTLQAICDLRTVVFQSTEATRARIAAGVDSQDAKGDLDRLIVQDGCCIRRPQSMRLHQGLVLAATLPEDDFEAFQLATAILIADRLQGGLGKDDLFWHWDAFREHYATTVPAIRACMMQGFYRLQADRRVTLQDPPSAPELLTDETDFVLSALQVSPGENEIAVRTAIDTGSVGDELWQRHCAPHLDPKSRSPIGLLRGIRHLLERHPDWDPLDPETFDPTVPGPAVVPMILS